MTISVAREKRLLTLIALLICLIFVTSQSFAKEKVSSENIKIITDAADALCKTVPIEVESNKYSLDAQAKVELNALFSKIVNPTVSAGGKIEHSDEKRAVLEKDLPGVIKDNSDCREKVFDKLTYIMFLSNQMDGSSTFPKLSWERDKAGDNFHWHLKVDNGPVHNLDVDSLHGVYFSYFPPGSKVGSGSGITFSFYPLEAWGQGADTQWKLDFSGVERELSFIADRFSEVVPEDDENSEFGYQVFLFASYESDAGVKYDRAWFFERRLRSKKDIQKSDYKLKETSIKEYRNEEVIQNYLIKCKRSFFPTVDGASVNWSEIIRKGCALDF